MRLQITDTEAEYYASVIDDSEGVLVDYCSADYPTYFIHNGNLYVVLGPNFGLGHDWKIYELTKVA